MGTGVEHGYCRWAWALPLGMGTARFLARVSGAEARTVAAIWHRSPHNSEATREGTRRLFVRIAASHAKVRRQCPSCGNRPRQSTHGGRLWPLLAGCGHLGSGSIRTYPDGTSPNPRSPALTRPHPCFRAQGTPATTRSPATRGTHAHQHHPRQASLPCPAQTVAAICEGSPQNSAATRARTRRQFKQTEATHTKVRRVLPDRGDC